MYKILDHVIDCYVERSGIFTSTTATEMDYLAKIQTEIFELLFANQDVILKWEESTSQQTKNAKILNNWNAAHTIGLKADVKIITNPLTSSPVDRCNLEASKDSNDNSKIVADKFKLVIESKVVVDYIVNNLPKNQQVKYVPAQNIQASALQVEICSLNLVDFSLYIHDVDFDISLLSSIMGFNPLIIGWLRKLLHFRRNVLSNAAIVSSMPSKSQQTSNEACHRAFVLQSPTNKDFVSPMWTQGTFFHTYRKRSTPIMPADFLTPLPTIKRKTYSSISRCLGKE